MDILLFLLIIGAVLLLVSVIGGIVVFLMQAGVIFQKAVEPTHTDSGDYFLEQGRDVGKE